MTGDITLAGRAAACARDATLPGVALALVERGEVVNFAGYGETQLGNRRLPDADTVFRIASMTKSFTAAATLLLRDRGALRLDDPLVAYLPWTRTLGEPAGAAPVTLADLLTMNAGFPTDDP